MSDQQSLIVAVLGRIPSFHVPARISGRISGRISNRISGGLLSALLLSAFCSVSDADFNVFPLTHPESAQELQSVLSAADRPFEEKVYACKQAARFASTESVAVLASYLCDEKLSQAARLALLQIPGPEAREALCGALKQTENPVLLAGILRATGQRREAEAVPAIQPFLAHRPLTVIQAAAEALGEIGAEPAAQALLDAWSEQTKSSAANTSQTIKPLLAPALFSCARFVRKEGQADLAQTIYQTISDDAAIASVFRGQALSGLIDLLPKEQREPLFWQAFDSPDPKIQAAFFENVGKFDETKLAQRLTNDFPSFSAEKKTLTLKLIKDQKITSAADFVFKICITPGDVPLRNAALDTFSVIGSSSYMKELFRSATDAQKGDWSVVVHHLSCMQRIPDPGFDPLIVEMLDRNEGPHRSYMLFLAAARKIKGAQPYFLKDIVSDSIWERRASVQGLVAVMAIEESDPLFKLYPEQKPETQESIAEAIRGIARRDMDPEQSARGLTAVNEQQKYFDNPQLRTIWLNALAATGSATALAFFDKNWDGANADVQDTVLQTLGTWPNESAAELLIKAAKSAANEKLRIRAIRGLLRIVRQMDVDPNQRYRWAKQVEPLIEQIEEKKLFVEALGRLGGVTYAFETVLSYRDIPEVRVDAEKAAFDIVQKMDYQQPAIFDKLKELAAQTADEQVKRDIEDLLNGIPVRR